MGRVKVVAPDEASCSRDTISEIVGASSFADTRGRVDLPVEEVAETTCVNDESDKSFSKRGERVSGTILSYCSEVEYRTEFKPFSLNSMSVTRQRQGRSRIRTHCFALSTTPGTCSELPTTKQETWPPSFSAAESADRDPESMTPSRCSRKTRA